MRGGQRVSEKKQEPAKSDSKKISSGFKFNMTEHEGKQMKVTVTKTMRIAK